MRVAVGSAFGAAMLASLPAVAQTLPEALRRAYLANPTLNAGRAALRTTDEEVPRALSGYRPTVSASASAGPAYQVGRIEGERRRETLFPREFGLQITQNVFNGFRTANATRQAENEVLAGRETLRATEQDTLLAAAQAYMDVLRDTAIVDLQRNNAELLVEQLNQTRGRRGSGPCARGGSHPARDGRCRPSGPLIVGGPRDAGRKEVQRRAGESDGIAGHSRICSLTSLGRASAARSKAATLSSKGNVAVTRGFRSTLPDAIMASARSNTLA